MQDHVELWNKCLGVIRDNISDAAYRTWFEPIVPLKYENDEFILQVPSAFFYEYLEQQYALLLRFTLNKLVGANTRLMYKIMVDQANKEKGSTTLPTAENGNRMASPAPANPFDSTVKENLDPRLNPTYSFSTFVEGLGNKLARCAGLKIAEEPGKSLFNPMYIYGKSGVGKTHLANAIGLMTKQLHPEKRVLYISANLFLLQYTDAVRRKTLNDFLLFYQSLDVLIIDDIQEFIGKTATQNTFFNIFNHLHQLGKQLIMCCDRDPNMLEGMEERLITRFKWGLQVEIEKPDLNLRRAILQNKIYNDGLDIPADVVEYVAEHVSDNIRNMEGVLISLLAHSTLMDTPIDLNLAKKIVGNVTPAPEKKQLTLEKIRDVVCEYYSLPVDALNSKSRERRIVEPRQIVMYLARTHTNIALSTIGSAIGNRDHTTVLYACKNVKNQMDTDKGFLETIHKLEDILSAVE